VRVRNPPTSDQSCSDARRREVLRLSITASAFGSFENSRWGLRFAPAARPDAGIKIASAFSARQVPQRGGPDRRLPAQMMRCQGVQIAPGRENGARRANAAFPYLPIEKAFDGFADERRRE